MENKELLKEAQQLRDENHQLRRLRDETEVRSIRDCVERDKEIKEKDTYFESLEKDLGRERGKLLQVTQKVTDSEKVINELMIKL